MVHILTRKCIFSKTVQAFGLKQSPSPVEKSLRIHKRIGTLISDPRQGQALHLYTYIYTGGQVIPYRQFFAKHFGLLL